MRTFTPVIPAFCCDVCGLRWIGQEGNRCPNSMCTTNRSQDIERREVDSAELAAAHATIADLARIIRRAGGYMAPDDQHALWRAETLIRGRTTVVAERCVGAGTVLVCRAPAELGDLRCRACRRVILERTVEHMPGVASLFGRSIADVAADLDVEIVAAGRSVER